MLTLNILQAFTDNPDININQTVPYLCHALVAEWIGPYTVEYQSFPVSTQLLAEAPHFLQKELIFCCELEDFVITALVNALRIPIVVFTSAPNFPMTIYHHANLQCGRDV